MPTSGAETNSPIHNSPQTCMSILVMPEALIPVAGMSSTGELRGSSNTENTSNVRSC